MSDSKYAQISRKFETWYANQSKQNREHMMRGNSPEEFKVMDEWSKMHKKKKIPPRKKGSERSYSFKSKGGTRYSDKKKPKKGERRMD